MNIKSKSETWALKIVVYYFLCRLIMYFALLFLFLNMVDISASFTLILIVCLYTFIQYIWCGMFAQNWT